ncbi:MAG: AMP-binding protein [Dehalococcoidia bacterium]
MMLVTSGIDLWSQREPDRPAIVCGEQVVTYGQLAARTDGIANGLAARLGPDDPRPVGLLVQDPGDFLTAFLAIVKTGRAAMPLSPQWRPAEFARALATCPAALVIGEAPHAAGAAPSCVALQELEASNTARPGAVIQPDMPFYIGFTSGSTGAPRALVRDHQSWVASFDGMTEEFGIGSGEPVLVPGSPFFSFSLIAALHALYIGATVVLPSAAGVPGVLAMLRERPGNMYALPSLLERTLHLAASRGQTFPRLQRIICAGERLAPEVKCQVPQVFPDAGLYEYYGASEFGFATLLRPDEHEARPDSVGRPFSGCEIAVLDLDHDGKRLTQGKIGVLHVKNAYGPVSAYGESEEPLPPAGQWRTAGDLARQDADGYVYLVGRRDNMVVIKGENVYPEEAEAVLTSAPGVVRAVAVPWPEEQPTHLVALVETNGGGVGTETLTHYCREHLSQRKSPQRVVLVDRLPTTATGKVDRVAARALLAETHQSGNRAR